MLCSQATDTRIRMANRGKQSAVCHRDKTRNLVNGKTLKTLRCKLCYPIT